jgi:20S proteasome subunit beta 7
MVGASVVGLCYKDGVLLMADTLLSYGSMARSRTVQRIHQVNSHTALGASGEFSDFQQLLHRLEELK